MAFDDWEKDENGNIKLFPLTGWSIFKPYDMMCGVRFEFITGPEELGSGKPGRFLPLVLTPDRARELAQALLRTADMVQTPGAPNEKRH